EEVRTVIAQARPLLVRYCQSREQDTSDQLLTLFIPRGETGEAGLIAILAKEGRLLQRANERRARNFGAKAGRPQPLKVPIEIGCELIELHSLRCQLVCGGDETIPV